MSGGLGVLVLSGMAAAAFRVWEQKQAEVAWVPGAPQYMLTDKQGADWVV